MKKISLFVTRVAVIAGLAVGGFAVAALADWTAPVSGPPTCATGNPGCDAPIHVGLNSQTKAGSLTLNKDLAVNVSGTSGSTGFVAYGKSIFNGSVQLVDSTPGDDEGKVLTSDANGLASWQVAQAGGGGGGGGGTSITVNDIINGFRASLSHIHTVSATPEGPVTAVCPTPKKIVSGGCAAVNVGFGGSSSGTITLNEAAAAQQGGVIEAHGSSGSWSGSWSGLSPGPIGIKDSYPLSDGTGWYCSGDNTTRLTAYAVCL